MSYRQNPKMVRLGWSKHLARIDTTITMRLLGRYPIRVQVELLEAVAAMEATLIETGYENPTDFIGSWHVRPIGGTETWSTHAYGTAIDLDYGGDTDGDGDPTIDKNPHVRRPIVPGDPGFGVEWQILEHQVRAVEAIRNIHGEQVWRWLGWAIGDTMHWTIGVRPDRTAIDTDSIGGHSMWANDFTDKTWMRVFHSGVPGIQGVGRYYCSDDGTFDFDTGATVPEGDVIDVAAPWGSDPYAPTPDGGASYDEKINAINYLLQGFSISAGS